MSELPASVRTALWATSLWSQGESLEGLWEHATPDLEAVGGAVSTLPLWRELGESALVVALSTRGLSPTLPRCSPEAMDEVLHAGECVIAPTLGALLVPTLSEFGAPTGDDLDRGTRLDWAAHDCAPLPTHRIEALDARDIRRRLLESTLAATTEPETLGGAPWRGLGADAQSEAPARARRRAGLPPGIPEVALAGLTSAETISAACHTALTTAAGGLTVAQVSAREAVLRDLRNTADRALEEFTNVSVAVLAGWRPA